MTKAFSAMAPRSVNHFAHSMRAGDHMDSLRWEDSVSRRYDAIVIGAGIVSHGGSVQSFEPGRECKGFPALEGYCD